jgi:ABC-type bacteriocin/lantibiotic exporter with double-glycine peptidase domain
MQINSNIYAFLSGILVSLSTNIFTTLCFEPLNLIYQWHLYLSTLLFVASGALSMFISVKVSVFQNFIVNKQITEHSEIQEIIEDITGERKHMWIIS